MVKAKIDPSFAEAIRKGQLTPEQAVALHDQPSTPIGEIEFDFVQEPLMCGFPTFEKHRYLRKGKPDLIVLAARPGFGKTSLVSQIALNVSKHSNVLMYSLEMVKEQIMPRLTAIHAQKDIAHLGKLSPEQQAKYRDEISSYHLRIDDTNALDIHNIVNRTKNLNDKWPLSLVIVDYMQIVAIQAMRSKSEEVSKIAEKLKKLAMDIKVPVIAVAQMNRNVEARYGQTGSAKPMMSDIADSAGIERNADLIMFLHRPAVYDKTRQSEAEIVIAKNRNGSSEDFTMRFVGSMTKFFDDGI